MAKLSTAQAALYEAERCLHPRARRFTDIREIRAYLGSLVASDWFQDRWPHLTAVDAYRREGNWSSANIPSSTIHLTRYGYSLDTVLHELAHLAAARPGHTLDFAEVQLTLVRREMGFEAWVEYYRALRATQSFASVCEGVEHRARQLVAV